MHQPVMLFLLQKDNATQQTKTSTYITYKENVPCVICVKIQVRNQQAYSLTKSQAFFDLLVTWMQGVRVPHSHRDLRRNNQGSHYV